MTLRTLFDKGRRTDIQKAIEKGEPLPFQGRRVETEKPRRDIISVDRATGPEHMGDGVEYFTGHLISSVGPAEVGGYTFDYNGEAPEGVKIGISCGGDEIGVTTLPVGKKSALEIPEDAKRIRITPGKCGQETLQVMISVEPIPGG